MLVDPPQRVLLLCSGKNPANVSALSALGVFYLGVAFHHQSLKALIVGPLEKACPSPSLIWHRMKQ